jgi:hypothetical protein
MRPLTACLGAVLALLLIFSTPVKATHPAVMDSIDPLQWVSLSMINVGPFLIPGDDLKIGIHCTTFQVGSHYHLTDFHCIGDDDTGEVLDRGYYVGTEKAKVVDWDYADDLAILETKSVNEHPLDLADQVAMFDHIETAGFSFGWKQPQWFAGQMGSVGVHDSDWGEKPFNIYVVNVAGGQSGSPVINSDGKVVGIVQRTQDPRMFNPVGYGPTLHDLAAFAEWAFYN